MKTFEEVESLYNTYLDESEAYVDRVIATDFVMTPPSFEEMKQLVGRQEAINRGFRDHSSTIIRLNSPIMMK
jgi:hypothetical protein